MDYFKKHKLVFSTIVIQLLALPLVLTVIKQQRDTRTRAAEPENMTPVNVMTPTPEESPAPNISPSPQSTSPESLGDLEF
ncbi:MAG: hypothetical protein ACD_37C00576G0002 [uncultured bacterium]|nr:MAG: hypothetical protein ACD_37C00576G0002 [uncultured bacterium]